MAIIHWPDRVESLVDRIGPPLTLGRVVASCASTQDLARALGVGGLIVAGRQEVAVITGDGDDLDRQIGKQ